MRRIATHLFAPAVALATCLVSSAAIAQVHVSRGAPHHTTVHPAPPVQTSYTNRDLAEARFVTIEADIDAVARHAQLSGDRTAIGYVQDAENSLRSARDAAYRANGVDRFHQYADQAETYLAYAESRLVSLEREVRAMSSRARSAVASAEADMPRRASRSFSSELASAQNSLLSGDGWLQQGRFADAEGAYQSAISQAASVQSQIASWEREMQYERAFNSDRDAIASQVYMASQNRWLDSSGMRLVASAEDRLANADYWASRGEYDRALAELAEAESDVSLALATAQRPSYDTGRGNGRGHHGSSPSNQGYFPEADATPANWGSQPQGSCPNSRRGRNM